VFPAILNEILIFPPPLFTADNTKKWKYLTVFALLSHFSAIKKGGISAAHFIVGKYGASLKG